MTKASSRRETMALRRATRKNYAITAKDTRNGQMDILQPRPIDEWCEEIGPVLWWCWRDGEWLVEPPYVGSPLDLGQTVEMRAHGQKVEMDVGGWPDYHTHWTPLQPLLPPLRNKE